MIKQIDYWLKGYIRVKVRGRRLERLINLLLEQQIELWGVRRIEGEFYTNIKLEDLAQLKEYLNQINCEYKMIDYYGLPYLIKRVFKRKFLFLGVITFIILIYIFSSFVFFIEIRGTKRIDGRVLKKQLAELKVKRGVLKSSIPLTHLEEIIISQNERIVWANLYFRGTRLVLEVVEKKLIDTEIKPSDIVAKKSGLIKEIIVFRGTAKVQESDIVKKGELLISKEVKEKVKKADELLEEEKEEYNINEVKAAGLVKAKVWYEGYGEAPLIKTVLQPTSQREKNIILKYRDKEIIISGPKKMPYNHFLVEENIKRLSQWRNIKFPLEIITKKYTKLKQIKIRRTAAQAKEIAKEKALESILQQLEKEVIIMNSDLKLINAKEENLLRVKAILEVEEDIATRRE